MCPLRCSILQEEHLEGARSSIDLSERTKAGLGEGHMLVQMLFSDVIT